MDEVKRELAKLMSHQPANDGAGTSSSASSSVAAAAEMSGSAASLSSSGAVSAAKPTDISHLIKRKKPDEPNKSIDESSPAKRAA